MVSTRKRSLLAEFDGARSAGRAGTPRTETIAQPPANDGGFAEGAAGGKPGGLY